MSAVLFSDKTGISATSPKTQSWDRPAPDARKTFANAAWIARCVDEGGCTVEYVVKVKIEVSVRSVSPQIRYSWGFGYDFLEHDGDREELLDHIVGSNQM